MYENLDGSKDIFCSFAKYKNLSHINLTITDAKGGQKCELCGVIINYEWRLSISLYQHVLTLDILIELLKDRDYNYGG